MAKIILPHNFIPRKYQQLLWSYMETKEGEKPIPEGEGGKRAVAVWHRRAGKDVLAINLVATKVFERVGVYWHLLPTYKQGRAIVWNGFTREGRKFLDHFPREIVKPGGKNKTEMSVEFINGSRYQVVGTDDVDSLVGTNPVGVIFSEYSLQDPGAWNYLRPILAENGGWALFIYTMRGKNHGYQMLEMARKNTKWFHQVLVAGDAGTQRDDGTPVISDRQIQDERESGMPEEMIQQEFFCSADAPLAGAYYGAQMTRLDSLHRITTVAWEPRLPVDTSWDLGIDDEMVVWFFQDYSGEVRVIDHVKLSGESLLYFIRILRGRVDGYERMGDYEYRNHFAPHDIEVRELGTGKSRIQVAKEHGLKFTVVHKHEVEDRIEVVRQSLPMCWFDTDRCDRGVQALKSYRKEWDEKNKCYRSRPLHDWSSHDADAFGIYFMGRRRRLMGEKRGKQDRVVDDHDYLRA